MHLFTSKKLATRAKTRDNRSGRDRRVRRWGNLIWLFRNGQRRNIRRDRDRRTLRILDYYSPKLFYSLTLVLLLSIGDAFLTIFLIGHGAEELNPVMAYFLQYGPYIFILAKYLFTALSVVIVVLFNYAVLRYSNLKFKSLMPLFAGCFGLVVAWELFLIGRLLL